MVTFSDKRSYRARVVGKDEKTDLAILQIREKGTNQVPQDLKPIPLGDSDTTRIGEGAFAVGEPFGLGHTVTLGIISAKNRTIGEGPFDNFLQTDASINPGNSGGPLLNLRGEVIGINTMIVSRTGQTAGLGFAIPINEAKALIPDLKRYGRIPRPWLGVIGERITPQLKEYYGLPVSEGVIILNVVEGAPAEGAGLQQGDIVVDIGGVNVTEPNDVERALAKHKPKDTISAVIRRGKKKIELNFKLEELPRLENLPKGII
jgi:serine protease Do